MTTIAKNDILINNMFNELNKIKKNQLNHVIFLNKSILQNQLLKELIEDYSSYYRLIKKQKQHQYNSLDKMSDYINSLSSDLNKTDNMLNKTKEDQKDILKEMKKIKREIFELNNY